MGRPPPPPSASASSVLLFSSTLLLALVLPPCALAQAASSIPFLDLLSTESMMQIAQLAAKLGTQTAAGSAAAEKEIMLREGAPELRPLTLNQRPSELLGQAFSNVVRPLKMQALQGIQAGVGGENTNAPVLSAPSALASSSGGGSGGNIFTDMLKAFGGSALGEAAGIPAAASSPSSSTGGGDGLFQGARDIDAESTFVASGHDAVPEETAPSSAAAALSAAATSTSRATRETPGGGGAGLANSPLMQLATALSNGCPKAGTDPSPGAASPADRLEGIPIRASAAAASVGSGQQQPILPGIRDVVPGATSNFGIPRGKGCLPFLGEFMQIAYGNCVKEADERAYETWGEELRSAVLSGKMDVLRATRESCKRGAEREQCNQLRHAISDCDIMQSLQITASLQRAIKRCEDISGIVDQNPLTVLGQVNNLINGEFASGFLNNFLG